MSDTATEERLKETALANLHRELGARMVPFAGYSMPVQYEGIIAEHRHTRAAAGLFDVSHMGQVRIAGPDYAAAAAALEAVTPGDFAGMKPGRMRYSMLLTHDGTMVDDIMVARLPGEAGETGLNIVFNAARVAIDADFVRGTLPKDVKLEMPANRSMLALQGPKAVDALAHHAAIDSLGFMDIAPIAVDGVDCLVSRSGYTGEDGFEIYLGDADVEAIARVLLAEPEVKPVGLGARDSLRLEAGLPLYGHDIDETTTPVEADLAFAIGKRRRLDGDFPGANRILDELVDGPVRHRVGLAIEGKMPAREGATIYAPDGEQIGTITSGGFGPTVDAPIAMGYVVSEFGSVGQPVAIEVRGKKLAAAVAPLPFVPHRYYRRGSKT
jgi:aminomethyltransferase